MTLFIDLSLAEVAQTTDEMLVKQDLVYRRVALDDMVVGKAKNSLGEGQTWQDIKSSRAGGTPYTNNTGQTITVMVSISWDGNSTGFSIEVDGISFSDVPTLSNDNPINTTLIIPAGSTYTVNHGTNYLLSWLELR